MTRHARNCTAGAVYTYHEKKKDAAASGYGTNTQRVGKDSVKDFDCCCLTLQPCRYPVVTYVFYSMYIFSHTLNNIIIISVAFKGKMVIYLTRRQYWNIS